MPIYNSEGDKSPCPGCGNTAYPNLEKKEVASLKMVEEPKLSGNRSSDLGGSPGKRPTVIGVKTVWSCRNCGWVASDNG